ncbi:MAG: 30S ribosomal protein S8 [Chloroflexi bacterium]|nr:30S ribosomal protein S8 [Chloroflexota bacterium]
MNQSDPIADMLTRIRNALLVRRDWVVAPSSKSKKAILTILKDEGFISDFHVVRDGAREMIRIHLRYDEKSGAAIQGLKRVSKPGLRVYMDKQELPRFYGGRGVSIVSTPQGMMTGQEAWRKGVGGELMCYVW